MNIVAAPTSSADPVDSRAMLLDGTVATLRVTGPADCSPLRRFFHELSPESRRLRFFKLADPDGALIDAFCDSSNPKRQATVVALRLLDGELRPIAVGFRPLCRRPAGSPSHRRAERSAWRSCSSRSIAASASRPL